jgi:hypothetical protein
MEYNAVGIPYFVAANENIIILRPNIISLIVKLERRSVYKANTSIPSTAQPARMVSPIPTPRKNPPKIEINNLSSVITGNSGYSKQIPSNTTVKKVLNANPLLMEKNEMAIKGRFARTITYPSGKPYTSCINSEIPVIPPSKK